MRIWAGFASRVSRSRCCGDSESGTTYSWSGGGASGSTQTLVVPLAAGADTITLTVTPNTDATITDPAVGVVQTATVAIPPSLGAFLTPDITVMTWSDADAYCTGLGGGARLPTKDELADLFLSATSATVAGVNNTEMCRVHNWPLDGQCRGSRSGYWSSTPNGTGYHYGVYLNAGNAYNYDDKGTNQVACVR